MDPAGRLFDHLRLEPVGGWAGRSIEHYCGYLRVDRRYFVSDQPLIQYLGHGLLTGSVPLEISNGRFSCLRLCYWRQSCCGFLVSSGVPISQENTVRAAYIF